MKPLEPIRIVLKLAVLAALSAQLNLSSAQESSKYPNKPIHWVIPFAASGPTDTMARVILQRIADRFEQPVIIDNKAGAGGSIGAEFVAHAPADGYTLLFTTSGVVTMNPSLSKVNFDTLRDFVPVVKAGSLASLLVVNPNLKVNNLTEFIQMAKAKPGQMNYATSGPGSTSHLSMVMFNRLADIELVHVPYKGAAPAVTDLLGNNVQVMLMGLTTVLPFVNSGKLQALGISTLQPSVMAPNVPTIASLGFAGFEVSNWLGFFAPINTPPSVVNRFNAEINTVIMQADIKAKLAKEGIDPAQSNTPAQFKAYVQNEIIRWSKTIKDANIKD
jgi:hypothetical protein